MDLRQVKELMIAMGRTGTRRLRIKQEQFEIELEHECPHEAKVPGRQTESLETLSNAMKQNVPHAQPTGRPAPLKSGAQCTEDSSEVQNGKYVSSPMVGTFYMSGGPDESPFVKVGDKIEKDTVVCIIEAMKVMNEVKAGADGILTEVCVENRHPVEFGTKLFRITE